MQEEESKLSRKEILMQELQKKQLLKKMKKSSDKARMQRTARSQERTTRFKSAQPGRSKKIASKEAAAPRFSSLTPKMIEDQRKHRISRPKLGSSLGIKQNRLVERANFRSLSKSAKNAN